MSSIAAGTTSTTALVSTADTTGALVLKTGASAVTALTIDASQNATFVGNVSGVIKSGTVVPSTSGTSIDFTNIPATAKRITVFFNGVSTTSTSPVMLQLGTGATPTYTTTGYTSTSVGFNSTNSNALTYTTGLGIDGGGVSQTAATTVRSGQAVLSSYDGLTWTYTSNVALTVSGDASLGSGRVTLAAVLTAVRVTTVGGANTFDLGSLNIMWE